MKERPILFSGPMVRAILEGRKNMTRRVIKPQPKVFNGRAGGRDIGWPLDNHGRLLACPYGQPGDQLWVRETWCSLKEVGFSVDPKAIAYRASTGQTLKWRDEEDRDEGEETPRWKPSIFMPRWASRILLEVVSARVERVQDISEADAKAEGAEAKRWGDLKQIPTSLLMRFGRNLPIDPLYVYGFGELWDSINSARGYGWDVNPWVWVVEFKRIGT